MTTSHGTATVPTLAEQVLGLLADSPSPLQLPDLLKKLPKPPKPKKAKGQPAPAPVDFGADVRQVLDDGYRVGRVFRHPSWRQGAERYWGRDEKQAIRDAALEAADGPKTLAQLRTAAVKAAKGAAAGFVDGAVRDLIGEDALFEHPAKTKAGGPLFAAFPPPPPVPTLEQARFKRKVDALVTGFERLLTEAAVPAEELLAVMRTRLGAGGGGRDSGAGPARPVGPSPAAATAAGPELDALILKSVLNAGPGSVLSLADLRREMPAQYRGQAFDEAVFRLAEEDRVRVYQDSDPAALSARERAECVDDGHGHVFKTIAKRG